MERKGRDREGQSSSLGWFHCPVSEFGACVDCSSSASPHPPAPFLPYPLAPAKEKGYQFQDQSPAAATTKSLPRNSFGATTKKIKKKRKKNQRNLFRSAEAEKCCHTAFTH